MSNFHVIGTGGCGFLRMYYILKDHMTVKYKGGGPKYQNSFETWNENDGLIWDVESLSKEERIRRVSFHFDKDEDGWVIPNITHSYLKYIPEFLEFYPDMKFLCLRGQREHSIKSLAVSWGYRNPCYVKDRQVGLGHNRYAVSQFPDCSEYENEFVATEKYWDEYYTIANELQEKYPNNLLIVDAPTFFSDTQYQLCCLSWIGMDISVNSSSKAKSLPVDFKDWTITTSLHGGLGNNLFQMAEVISFCEKFKLPEPKFGTWDLWNGGGKYPPSYNADKFLGGHDGTHSHIRKYFPKLNWNTNMTATFDTKFVVNDMFSFNVVDKLDYIRKVLLVDQKKIPNSVSLHLRFCTRPADDHVNGYVDDNFYKKVFEQIPLNSNVYIFADDSDRAREKLPWFKAKFSMNFKVIEADAFQSLKMMAECEYHILHVSTFSFWSAFLDPDQPNSKVFYPQSFVTTHTSNMIPYKEWQML
jgi:hypothetical protein